MTMKRMSVMIKNLKIIYLAIIQDILIQKASDDKRYWNFKIRICTVEDFLMMKILFEVVMITRVLSFNDSRGYNDYKNRFSNFSDTKVF